MRDNRQKLINLEEARVNRAIKDIRLIGNLANKNASGGKDTEFRLEE